MKYFLALVLILFGSAYCFQMADGTLSGDYDQLEWIKNGRKGMGDRVRIFKTYSESYINKLELQLHSEATRMWSFKTISTFLGFASFVLLLFLTLWVQFKKDWASVIAVNKNTDWHWLLFGLGMIITSYCIHEYFLAGDLLSKNENISTAIYFSILTLLISPINFFISVVAGKQALRKGLETNKWKYYLAIVLFTLSALTVIVIGIGLLATPDLGGHWG